MLNCYIVKLFHCLLFTCYFLLPTASCPLPTAYCTVHSTSTPFLRVIVVSGSRIGATISF
ncbi:MAG: hypothetical protein COS14_12070 [Bacteroidetes bacterium CG02_land_8_20_14_3_00_31_25]|nr:MAG: hypothetical protein COS14_12070 [Bacteroidetes bacterium CG02_land_8_20_14_3_00_31_25]